MFAELPEAAEYTELLASSVDLTVRSLATLDGAALFDAEAKLLASKDLMARIGRPRTAPVRDGQLVREWTYCAAPSPRPLLIGWTRDEARFWYDLHDADGNRLAMMSAPREEAGLVDQIGRLLHLYYPFDPSPRPTDVIAAYRHAADPTDRRDPIDAAWNEIYTDLVFRAPIVHQAARHARIGAPTYAYEFAHSLPAPGRGSPHASDVPFVFGTTGHPHLARKVGNGSSVQALSTLMLDAWAAFVRSGDPATERLPWPAWTSQREATARFTTASSCSVTALDRCDQLRVFQAFNP
jgi:para-nitrobenzyl esterase